MLRRDTSAGFEKSGVWIFSRYRFHGSGQIARQSYNRSAYNALVAAQQVDPVLVMSDEARKRGWWLFRDDVFAEDEGYTAEEVKALALQRLSRKDRRLKHAIAMMEQGETPELGSSRAPIPDEVKVFVWNRDGGRCVRCGSAERLEFDHIIPVALGGANTARNLQVLCETCNRSKGASIA